jgi:hypothetical protein
MPLRDEEANIGPAPTTTSRRELAHRAGNGIEVFLFWIEASNRVTVEVFEAGYDVSFEFDVDGGAALDAFNHPYAYAASTAASPRSAVGLAALSLDDPRKDS